MNKENFKEILLALHQACKEMQLEANADMKLDCATRIFNAEYIQACQEASKAAISKQLTAIGQSEPVEFIRVKEDKPVSEKQKKWLKQFKIPFDDKMTMREASALLDRAFAKKEGVI